MQQYSGQQMPGRSSAHQLQPGEAASAARQASAAGWPPDRASGPYPAHDPSAEDDALEDDALEDDALAVPWAGALADEEEDADATMAFPAANMRAAGHPAPPETAEEWEATSFTLSPRKAAGVSYLFWWVSGLVVYFNERHNTYVRFHAVQSILLTGSLTVFAVLAYIASNLLGDVYLNTRQHVFSTLATGVALLSFFAIAILWLAPMIAAFSGEEMRLPIVGEYAERYAALPPQSPTR
ncbi:MAG: hypothetical protein IVW57_13775 [Ktedonobacterales bacterium]|nr:hypothetical protein [Ktedonobacterales bacterium]